jgi:hypothetical protein
VENWLAGADNHFASDLIERVQHIMKVSAEYARVLVSEYLDFLELKAAVQDWAPQGLEYGCRLSPPPLIDEVWHLHILDTQRYQPDCEHLFGQMIHHDPNGARVDRGNDKIWKRARIERTVAAYKSRFGRAPRLSEVWAFPQGSVWRGEWNEDWEDFGRGECNQHVKATARRTGKDICLTAFGALTRSCVRFMFDGTSINDQLTPMDLDMEDGDVIDVVRNMSGC